MSAIREAIFRIRNHEPSGVVSAENLARQAEKELNNLEAALLTILDQVDYTSRACAVTEMVGAVLPMEVIVLAREALAKVKE